MNLCVLRIKMEGSSVGPSYAQVVALLAPLHRTVQETPPSHQTFIRIGGGHGWELLNTLSHKVEILISRRLGLFKYSWLKTR